MVITTISLAICPRALTTVFKGAQAMSDQTPPPYDPNQAHQYQQPANPPVPVNGALTPKQISDLKLNYWLSAFFAVIPAVIFWATSKGQNRLLDQHLVENLNFSIIRTGVGLVAVILAFVPVLPYLINLASLALFIIAIIAAVKGSEAAEAGQEYKFIFNFPIVK